ncbi:MAG: EthD family reductase [Rhodococcus sp. (in: high G+C Gram-positive bacteria)]|nr:MAG: EthD family reductase [Rhodococcus sp. (in: high G+C Gram-positive bacteria)]
MHKLTVCYGQPQDSSAFDEYYTSKHAPLAKTVPGMVRFTYGKCEPLGGVTPDYYLIAELAFDSRPDLEAALQSPQGQTASADLANFATGGVTMLVHEETS